MQFFFMVVGILSILLAILAEWLGVDNNAVWGTGRILLLIFGIILLEFGMLVHKWKTGHLSDKIRHPIAETGRRIQSDFSLFFIGYPLISRFPG